MQDWLDINRYLSLSDPLEKRIFLKFLIAEGIAHEFISNVDRDRIEDSIKITNLNDIIVCSFQWRATPQGYEYWSRLDKKWYEYFEPFKKRSKDEWNLKNI